MRPGTLSFFNITKGIDSFEVPPALEQDPMSIDHTAAPTAKCTTCALVQLAAKRFTSLGALGARSTLHPTWQRQSCWMSWHPEGNCAIQWLRLPWTSIVMPFHHVLWQRWCWLSSLATLPIGHLTWHVTALRTSFLSLHL